MKATQKLHKCIEHHDNCKREWYAYSVEDEPIYTVCEICLEKDCEEERELTSDIDN